MWTMCSQPAGSNQKRFGARLEIEDLELRFFKRLETNFGARGQLQSIDRQRCGGAADGVRQDTTIANAKCGTYD